MPVAFDPFEIQAVGPLAPTAAGESLPRLDEAGFDPFRTCAIGSDFLGEPSPGGGLAPARGTGR